MDVSGKHFHIARHVDVAVSITTIRYFAGWADKIQGKTIEVGTTVDAHVRAQV